MVTPLYTRVLLVGMASKEKVKKKRKTQSPAVNRKAPKEEIQLKLDPQGYNIT